MSKKQKKKRTASPRDLDLFAHYPPEEREQAQQYFRLYMDNWFNQTFADAGMLPEPQGENVVRLDRYKKKPKT